VMECRSPRGPRLCVLFTLVLAGFTTGLVLAAATDAWTPAVNLSSIPGRSTQATLAQNSLTGDLFVAWTDEGVAPKAEILGRRWDPASQSWQPDLGLQPENLSQSEWVDGGPMFFFDHQGHGLLLWTRRYAAFSGAPADGTDLLWRSWEGTAWSAEAVLVHADTYLPGTYYLIPIETPDSILLFIIFDRGYRTSEYRDGHWSAVSPWSYLDVSLAQIVRDDNGLLHAAGYGPNSSQVGWDQYFRDAYYLTFDGTNWSVPLNLSSADGVADNIGLAFDGEDRLHFMWSDPDSSYSSESLLSAIWERVYDGTLWSPNAEVTLYNSNQGITAFSLTTDASDILHLAWSEGIFVGNGLADLGIYYQFGNGTIWTSEEKVYTSTAESRYPTVVAGHDGVSLIWQEGPLSDRDVNFSRQVSGGFCQGLTGISIEGPQTGVAGHSNTFAATSIPFSATLPITYTWQASGQSPITHKSGLVDTASVTWIVTGTQMITVTAENCGGVVTDTHTIAIGEQTYTFLYLPLVAKESAP
jgi:hypothetical protein